MDNPIVPQARSRYKRPQPYRIVPADAAAQQGRGPLLFALSIRVHNVPDVPCPICAAPVTYHPAEHVVFCRGCGLTKILSLDQSHDLLWALLDLNDVGAGLLLRALVHSNPEPPPYPDTLPTFQLLTAPAAPYGLEGAA